MEEPEKIVDVLEAFFLKKQSLKGKKILITAGPTYEKIDPVRFIGNYSSGKMGFALAETAAEEGAEVTLVAGPVSLSTSNPKIKRIDVESAQEMYDVAMNEFSKQDAAILCAAVADYRPKVRNDVKIKRENNQNLSIELVANPDIAASLGAVKKDNQVMVGFALETNDAKFHAKDKMKRKNLDFIVVNSLEDKGAGFQCDTNKISIIDDEGGITDYPLKSKSDVAKDIIEKLSEKLNQRTSSL
jgi:phosphopantothenoylcysteine decarboxylase/phosphopantothenate--cysteine ligase